jgi:hypothetical protein
MPSSERNGDRRQQKSIPETNCTVFQPLLCTATTIAWLNRASLLQSLEVVELHMQHEGGWK